MTPPIASRRRAIGNEGERKITRASARARDFPTNYPRPSLRENALSVSILLALIFSPLSLRSISLPSSSLLAQPLFLPLIPSNRTSLDIPTVVSVGAEPPPPPPLPPAASRLIALFFSLSLSRSPPPLPVPLPSSDPSYPSRYTCTSGPRGERERLARNPPQNKRPSRRSRSRAARACSRARLPFRVFLTIDSLPSPSAKLPADAVRKERAGPRAATRKCAPAESSLSLSPVSIPLPFSRSPSLGCARRRLRARARCDCETR